MTFGKADTSRVKGTAILLMIFHHSFMADRYKGLEVIFAPFTEGQVNWVCWSFKICVAIFTFLSAYGMTLTYKREDPSYALTADRTQQLVLRRTIRLEMNFIYIYLASMAFGLCMNRHLLTDKYGPGAKKLLWILVDMLGLAQFFHTPTNLATYWYISLALILIFTMPLLLALYRRFGGAVLFGLSLLTVILFPVVHDNPAEAVTYAFFSRYIVCIVLGILAADGQWLEKIRDFRPLGDGVLFLALKGILEVFLIAALVYTRMKVLGTTLLPIWEGLIPLFVCAFHLEFLRRVPVLSRVLEVLGIYSMDIFLIHNLIRSRWFNAFTYSFGHFVLIGLVLTADSLAVSFLLEKIKKAIRYDRLTMALVRRTEKEAS